MFLDYINCKLNSLMYLFDILKNYMCFCVCKTTYKPLLCSIKFCNYTNLPFYSAFVTKNLRTVNLQAFALWFFISVNSLIYFNCRALLVWELQPLCHQATN